MHHGNGGLLLGGRVVVMHHGNGGLLLGGWVVGIMVMVGCCLEGEP